jgi:hypothetical protein
MDSKDIKDMTQVADMVRDAILPVLRDEAKRDIDGFIASYKRSWVTRDEWCCKPMHKFAVKFWCAPKPLAHTELGGVSLTFNGDDFIYCPFCGVKL